MSINKTDNEDIIELQAKVGYVLFPRDESLYKPFEDEGGIYAIVRWNIEQVKKGNPSADLITNDSVTVVGYYGEPIDNTKTYSIYGKEITNEKYGQQLSLLGCHECIDFTKTQHQREFLTSFLTEGQIEEFYKIYDNPIAIISAHDVDAMKKVHGVGDYIANAIIDRYENNKIYYRLYSELEGIGLTTSLINKLIGRYSSVENVLNVVKQHPYKLATEVDGMGFKSADKIAMSMGVTPKSPDRIAGYIHFFLESVAQEGFSYISAGQLTYNIFEEFNGRDNILEEYNSVYYELHPEDNPSNHIASNNVAEAIQKLEKEGVIVVETVGEDRRVYLKKFFNLENAIAEHLTRLNTSPNNFEFTDWEEKIATQEGIQGWKLTDEQREGVLQCLEHQVVLITGAAGTGKTSVLSSALLALGCMGDNSKYSFAQCSLSGKAAARMTEVTKAEGYTIHRLLGYNPSLGFKYNEYNKLPYDIIIVDEISMIGGEIFLSLLKAIPNGSKLIILGDMGQLESIGSLNLASDLYHSSAITTVELTQIHRQAKKSGIILASQKVRNQEVWFSNNYEGVQVHGELKDMIFDINLNREELRDKTMYYYKQYFENGKATSVMDVQVLVPVKERGDNCVYNLNNDIQEYVNPSSHFKNELIVEGNSKTKEKSFVFRVGDKVMCIKNNYHTFNTQSVLTPIYNGWVGELVELNLNNDEAIIYFHTINDKIVMSLKTLQSYIMLGYASTIHKYQGSSAKYIIGVIDNATPPKMLSKELVYTLLTRAERECVCIVQNRALSNAIQQSGVSEKNTFLLELLDSKKLS